MKVPFLQKIFFRTEIGPVLAACCLIPVICASLWVQKQIAEVGSLRDRVLFLQKKRSHQRRTRARDEEIVQNIQRSDPDYLEKHLCSSELLGTERQKRRMFLAQTNSSSPSDGGSENRLLFEEVKKGSSARFREREWIQTKRVRMNEEDLKKMLSTIEGIDIGTHRAPQGAPQIVITKFCLQKTGLYEPEGASGSESGEKSYLVDLQFLTREPLRP